MTPAGIDVVSSFKGPEGVQIWAMPLVYGGRLYCKGENELVCYDISGNPSPSTRQAAESR
jgi:hypothetical protein